MANEFPSVNAPAAAISSGCMRLFAGLQIQVGLVTTRELGGADNGVAATSKEHQEIGNMTTTLFSAEMESYLKVVREQESPIRIYPEQSIFASKTIHFDWKKEISGRFEGKDDHKNFIVADCSEADRSYVDFGAQKWKLAKIHFHRCSEHLLENESSKDGTFDAEIHFIHEPVRTCKDSPDKMIEPSDYLVLGLFVIEEEGRCESSELTSFFSSCKLGVSEVTLPAEIMENVSTLKQFYFYRGSLTTPPYSENVSWVVFETPLHLNRSCLDAIRPVKQSARDGQPWNRRFVLRNFQE